jgi:carbon-monoxide dehydrogenase large subunit
MRDFTTTRANTYVGSPVERVEDVRFVRGRGQFIGDIVRAGQWHAVVLRSPVAHALITSIDPSRALAMAGVHAVITAADLLRPIPTIPFRRPNPTIAPYAQPVLASDRVRYVGEPIALVLADSAERAEDAVQEISVGFDALPAVVDWRTSDAGETLLFPQTARNVASTFTAASGDADAAFRDAPYVRRERFRVQRHTALPMETRGLLAEWDAASGRLTMSGAAKLPFFNRRVLAGMLGLDETAVDYIELDVGGGFGARGEFYPEDFLVAFAARTFGHPVKWIEDRREHFLAIAHAREMEADIEIACERDGLVLGMRGIIQVDIGAYVRPNGMTPVRNVVQFLAGPYRIPNLHFEGRALVSNKTPAGTYRGPGRFEGCFFCERMFDIAARELDIDPLEMRRRNLLTDQDMPYKLAPVMPNDGFGETACDSGDYRVTFDRCLTEFGWSDKQALAGKLIDGVYHGVGIGCFIEGGGSGPRESAKAELDADGIVSVYVGSSAIGQGVETVMAQIAADALEIPMERVRVLHGSTTYLKEGFGSYGSRGTVMGGSAIVLACREFLAAFRAAAANALLVAADDLVIANGMARAAYGRSIALWELAGRATLTGEGTFSSSKATYTYGTAAAHVTVDPGTGRVHVLDYLVVDDVGRVINPLTLHGQVIGAAVQGLGSVFGEQLVYDESGQLLVGSLADYLLPVATDFPHLRAISLEQFPSPNNPLGAKGAGEGGIIPVGGALTNAVASALRSFGIEPRDLPLSPPRVWQLIEGARAAAPPQR